jgi:hypothetical protein
MDKTFLAELKEILELLNESKFSPSVHEAHARLEKLLEDVNN